ncbi:cation transporter [Roseibium denhamense]|uniref:Predicted Co/Zn/Cd cation transporter, cation efflux family n=1 Tax=Roseibium denhamense TaxID=76305 RepID=A0ABY1N633_9HYPH|nr:cation transporter [Roseibium denhamense]MTI06083.1 cation transporter [Roseibium denhamense]SMP01287.1 Predicted Co/Zn/Cd cation transporter, cation efflux family [Roseibium denhamense]
MTDTPALNIEKRALNAGKWANLVMAVAGFLTAWLSRSDAMLVDGLYSAVNFISAIAAARIGARVGLPPTRSRPWGHDFDEVLYVTFRSLILIGVLIFAAIIAGSKIWTFAAGGEVPELVFGPIAVYAVTIIIICLALAFNYHRAYRKSGKRSAVLKMEARAALIDGALSLGSGAALLSLPFLTGTPLGPFVPIGDAVIVLVLILAIIWQPLGSFRSTLADLAGVSAPGTTVGKASRIARKLAKENGYKFHRAAVLQAGRMHFAAVYINPQKPVTAAEMDRFQDLLSARLEDVIGPTRVEVMITARDALAPPAATETNTGVS